MRTRSEVITTMVRMKLRASVREWLKEKGYKPSHVPASVVTELVDEWMKLEPGIRKRVSRDMRASKRRIKP